MQTTKAPRTILVLEDEPEVFDYLEMALKCMDYSVELLQDGEEALSCLRAGRSDIAAVLLDMMLPNEDGLETLRAIREIDSHVPVIIVSGASSTFNVVTAMKNGASDFLSKPVAHEDLRLAVTKAMEKRSAFYAPPARSVTSSTETFLGNDPQMKEIQELIRQIGWSEIPVLIRGETGAGKEVLARELHAQSPRSNKLFLKLNCAALPSELVESELFGYERGAFTGAFQKKLGKFELADSGTILLDEIGDMDVRLQAKLLQVLQDHEFQRIGGKENIRVNVRVIAATHRDLEKAIADGSFREDLYYRLNVISLQVPPLRERKDDIIPLTEFLMQKHATKGVHSPTITPDLQDAMRTYHWPGNVRELENFVLKFMILRHAEMLAGELRAKTGRKPLVVMHGQHFQGRVEKVDNETAPIFEQVTKAKHQAETAAIVAALNGTRWNRRRAAALLKIDYKALLYKMKKLGVEEKAAAVAFPATEPAGGTMAAYRS
jgi:two-component system response regulator AtoC